MTENVNDNLNNAYNAARIIHSLIDNSSNVTQFGFEHFKDGPNPFYEQMDTGLILEEYYETPSKIYTSIGYWNILGSTSSQNQGFKKIMNKLKDILGLKLIKEGYQTRNGYFGAWWEITKINDTILPISKKKEKSKYIEYSECKNIWSKFKSDKNMDLL